MPGGRAANCSRPPPLHSVSSSLAKHADRAIRGRKGRVIPTNVHDSILMLVNGNCELMFAYHHPDLPLQSGSNALRVPDGRHRRVHARL